jgi:hypothetical protein
MEWITTLVGIALILFGRRLLWFFVGAVGFIIGVSLAARLLQGQSEWVILAVGIIAGIIGSMLVVFLQRLAIFIGGFLAGAFIIAALLQILNLQLGNFSWLGILIGGIAGAVLISSAFEWAVILLSSLAGSLVIIQNQNMQETTAALAFVGLLLVGIIFQSRSLKAERVPGRRN